MVFNNLPLVDLHRHLDGNIRAKTIWELAQKNSMPLPVDHFKDFISHVQITDKTNDLMEFLQKLDWGVKVLHTLDDCQRIGYENVEDLATAGIDYAELRFSPAYIAMQNNLPIIDVVEAIADGVNQGLKSFDVKANLIGILSRTYGVQQCQNELDALLAHKEKLVAIDLAGDEFNKPAELFINHFKQVDKAGLNVTIHAGEAAGPESVWTAIKELKAQRIGHGFYSYKDPTLLEYLVKHNITLEACLTSNYQTGTIANIADHPIKIFLEHGASVCLNTDDPGVEAVELRHEFQLAKDVLALSDKQIQQLQLNAVNAAFMSDSDKKLLLRKKAAL